MLDARTVLVIVKGKNETYKLENCEYLPDKRKWSLTYCDGKKFEYNEKNILYLDHPKKLLVTDYQIFRDGKELGNIQEIYEFSDEKKKWWYIVFRNGKAWTYSRDDLDVRFSCQSDRDSRNVLKYLIRISALSDITNDDGAQLLRKRYGELQSQPLSSKCVLTLYLNSELKQATRSSRIPIFPFGINKSQYQAVCNALENQLSIIQGPPGTGKTQTILNILANLILERKTVLVVSNNNSALENIIVKLAGDQYQLDFLAAFLGKRENQAIFLKSQTGSYPDISSWNEDNVGTREEVSRLTDKMKEIYDLQEMLAEIREELSKLQTEKAHHQHYVDETGIDYQAVKLRKTLSSDRIMRLWQECEEKKTGKPGLLFKLKSILIYGIADWKFFRQDLDKIAAVLQQLYYEEKEKEVILRQETLQTQLKSMNADETVGALVSKSLKILHRHLYEKYGRKERRTIFEESALYFGADDFTKEYPIVLSTTFSARSCLNPTFYFDYVIMDEASQVDLATGALALSVAYNAVIVGDEKQLPNVIPPDKRKEAAEIRQAFRLNDAYDFNANSFLASIIQARPEAPEILLKEHYRCHPRIIGYCNQHFYKNQLLIMTEDHKEEGVLRVIKIPEGHHAIGHYSQRQIDVIQEEVLPGYSMLPDRIGIIAPYNNQVSAMRRQLPDYEISTVHKFQGREKDTIIISTVDDQIGEFVDDANLLNVAVSRAKKSLVLIVSGNEQKRQGNIADLVAYIQYQNVEIEESRIYSIFDYLCKQKTEARFAYLKSKNRISEYDSENLMYQLIREILEECYSSLDVTPFVPLSMVIRDMTLLDDRECRYVMNPWTHLDFVIIHRSNQMPVLAIEVDGFTYHKEESVQGKRDKMKNHILEMYQIPLLRLSTVGSREREKIMSKINTALGEPLWR